jgi:hypothetical protein
MTSEAQRIAIAEACGWKVEQTDFKTFTLIEPNGKRWERFDSGEIAWTSNVIPNYLNDLNAMHDAVQTLNEQERVHLVDALLGSINREPDYNIDDDFCSDDGWKLLTATAKQIADAFCEVKGGLWKE